MTSTKAILAFLGLFALAACETPAHPDTNDHSAGGGMMNDGEVMSGGEVMLGDDTMMSGG